MSTKEKEELYIEPFRGEESTKLGVLRLKNLACPDKSRMKIMIGNTEIKPIGFDTYGHPIISKENYEYCDALKAIAEREGKFLPVVVEYDKKAFCMKTAPQEILDTSSYSGGCYAGESRNLRCQHRTAQGAIPVADGRIVATGKKRRYRRPANLDRRQSPFGAVGDPTV